MLLALLMSLAQAGGDLPALESAVAAAPGIAELRVRLADRYAKLGWHERAAASLDDAVRLAPDDTALRDRRGDVRAFLGRFDEAVADFDAHLAAHPADGPRHWRRGIACYWAGQHDAGRKQFEAYQAVDGSDVENVAFWWLCAAKTMGREAASKAMPDVGFDRRVPLMAIDKLYRGTATPADVETAIVAGAPGAAELRSRRFYGHLYLGLWHDARGETAAAKTHLEKAAVAHWLPGYMGEVARTHLQLLDARGRGAYRFDPQRWAKDFAAFAAADAAQPFAPGGIVFTGSSTIRRWKLDRDFPDLPALNRGFGGSAAPDVPPQLELLVLKHRPRTVVYYEGDNDLAAGRTPEEFAADVARFLAGVRAKSEAKIVVLGIKPTIRRWQLLEPQRRANGLAAKLCETARARFLDPTEDLLGPDGRPIPDCYVGDGLHLSAEGYRRVAAKLRPLLAP